MAFRNGDIVNVNGINSARILVVVGDKRPWLVSVIQWLARFT